jgi:hypothetical protein
MALLNKRYVKLIWYRREMGPDNMEYVYGIWLRVVG